MDKIQLKEIVGYLPYGLKWQLQTDIHEDFSEYEYDSITIFNEGAIWKLIGYVDGSYNIPMGEGEINGFIFGSGTFYANIGTSEIKPILRPLSDLTKEIEVNGEKFVPMRKLKNGGTDLNEYRYLEWKGYSVIDNEEHETSYDEKSKSFLQFYRGESRQCSNQVEKFQKLYEWHFDIHNLIQRGLAIDINTLKP